MSSLMVDTSEMFSILIIPITVFVASARAGYDYKKPAVSLDLPNNQNIYGSNHQPVIQPHGKVLPTVSYSLSYADYGYLKQYKSEQQGTQYYKQRDPLTIKSHHDNVYKGDYCNDNIDGSLSLENVQQDQISSNIANEPGYVNVHSTEPVITKHVYLHVPPPDIENPPSPVLQHITSQPKKIYNVIFIKTPSQVSANVEHLQELLRNRYSAPVTDKTLIYVLVKKSESQTVALPAPVQGVSKPEVFFVKYRTNLNNIATQINDGLAHTQSLEDISPLQPNLSNGLP